MSHFEQAAALSRSTKRDKRMNKTSHGGGGGGMKGKLKLVLSGLTDPNGGLNGDATGLSVGSRMGNGCVWRNPAMQKAWEDEQKKKIEDARQKAEEEKKKKAEQEKQAEIEAEKELMVRKELLDTGRLASLVEADARLTQLKAEVAALEAKAKGTTEAAEKKESEAEQAMKEAEERKKQAELEAQAVAKRLVEEAEKEVKQKQKEFEEAQDILARARRRELLEYKAMIGLPAEPTPFDLYRAQHQTQPPVFPKPTPAMLDLWNDPKFWDLPEADQRLLEKMNVKDQAQFGFGPLASARAAGKVRFAPATTLASIAASLGSKGVPSAPTAATTTAAIPDEQKDRLGPPLYDAIDLLKHNRFICVSDGLPPNYRVIVEFGLVEASFVVARIPTLAELPDEESKRIILEATKNYIAHATSDLIEKVNAMGGNAILKLDHELIEGQDPETTVVAAYGFGFVLAPTQIAVPHPIATTSAASLHSGKATAAPTLGGWATSATAQDPAWFPTATTGGVRAPTAAPARDVWGDPIPSTSSTGGWGAAAATVPTTSATQGTALADLLKSTLPQTKNDPWTTSTAIGSGWGTTAPQPSPVMRTELKSGGWEPTHPGASSGWATTETAPRSSGWGHLNTTGSGWNNPATSGWPAETTNVQGWGTTGEGEGIGWGHTPAARTTRLRTTPGWGTTASVVGDHAGSQPRTWRGQVGGGSGGQPWAAFLQTLAAEKLRMQSLEKEIEARRLAQEAASYKIKNDNDSNTNNNEGNGGNGKGNNQNNNGGKKNGKNTQAGNNGKNGQGGGGNKGDAEDIAAAMISDPALGANVFSMSPPTKSEFGSQFAPIGATDEEKLKQIAEMEASLQQLKARQLSRTTAMPGGW